MQAYFSTAHGLVRIDKSMWPYYCDANGAYLRRTDLAKPDVVPHILIRVETVEDLNTDKTHTFAAIVGPDELKVVDGLGREWHVSVDKWEIKSYIECHQPAFLDSLLVTCANCRKVVGPPGPLARSGLDHYKHILCANCPQ